MAENHEHDVLGVDVLHVDEAGAVALYKDSETSRARAAVAFRSALMRKATSLKSYEAATGAGRSVLTTMRVVGGCILVIGPGATDDDARDLAFILNACKSVQKASDALKIDITQKNEDPKTGLPVVSGAKLQKALKPTADRIRKATAAARVQAEKDRKAGGGKARPGQTGKAVEKATTADALFKALRGTVSALERLGNVKADAGRDDARAVFRTLEAYVLKHGIMTRQANGTLSAPAAAKPAPAKKVAAA